MLLLVDFVLTALPQKLVCVIIFQVLSDQGRSMPNNLRSTVKISVHCLFLAHLSYAQDELL